MKFHELTIGQKFEFQGIAYIKSTPMVASALENATQKFMARSAMVKLLDVLVPSTPSKSNQSTLQLESVHTAFETFYTCCQTALESIQSEINPDSFNAIKATLSQQRQGFLNSLKQA